MLEKNEMKIDISAWRSACVYMAARSPVRVAVADADRLRHISATHVTRFLFCKNSFEIKKWIGKNESRVI